MFGDLLPQAGKRGAERRHPFVLRLIADHPPGAMVAVLLAAPTVAARGLYVAARGRTDPDVGPGWRNDQRPNAPQLGGVSDRNAIRTHVAKPPPCAQATDP